jgi:hypothetical protein
MFSSFLFFSLVFIFLNSNFCELALKLVIVKTNLRFEKSETMEFITKGVRRVTNTPTFRSGMK